MSDFVWVKLDRDKAESFVGTGNYFGVEEDAYAAFRLAQGHVADSIRAALSEPSENQVERVARALHFNNPGWGEWDEMSDENQAIFRSDARAALFGVQEKKQEEGT